MEDMYDLSQYIKLINQCAEAHKVKAVIDNNVPECFREHPAIIKAGCLINYNYLKEVDEQLLNQEICDEVHAEHPQAVGLIPTYYLKYENCLVSVKRRAINLMHIPHYLLDQELIESALLQDGYALKFCPPEYKTKELCVLAVSTNGWAIEEVPFDLKDYDLTVLAAQKIGFYALEHKVCIFDDNILSDQVGLQHWVRLLSGMEVDEDHLIDNFEQGMIEQYLHEVLSYPLVKAIQRAKEISPEVQDMILLITEHLTRLKLDDRDLKQSYLKYFDRVYKKHTIKSKKVVDLSL